jgi:hypothetical protein
MSTNTNGSLPIKGLPRNVIDDLMAHGRQRGIYPTKLFAWLEKSDEAAIEPAEAWPVEFGKKSASALYQSFSAAAKKADLIGNDDPEKDVIALRQYDGHFYMIHKERYAAMQEEEPVAAE